MNEWTALPDDESKDQGPHSRNFLGKS